MYIFNIIFIFKSIFVAMALVFSTILINDLRKSKFKKERTNVVITGLIGAVSYFFDTLGIGSYATSTALLRCFKQIQYKNLPGTLNVTAVLPVLLEAFIFISIIEVDYFTIICMVVATCIGSWMGAYIVNKMPEQRICFTMAIALFLAASILLLKQFNVVSVDYVGVIGLTGIRLIIATFFSVFIGILLAIGIGSYAPFLALTLILGLNVRATFPIMMSATALGSCFASIKFINIGNYDRKASLSMTIAALFGVVIAAYIVKTLPLYALTWIAIGIIYYTSINLFMNLAKVASKN
jgi:uncharacterized membrane protein YfcA